MNCSKATPTNGNKSELFELIYNEVANKNETKAEALYSHFTSNIFKASFGDWLKINDESLIDRVDINGEPKLFSKESGDGYYYIDRRGNRIDFPKNNTSLFSKISSDVLDGLVQSVSIQYLTQNKGLSFENLTLTSTSEKLSLKEYLKDIISNRIEEIKDSRDIANLLPKKQLPLLLTELDELSALVSDYYKTMDLTFKETEETSQLESSLDEGGRDMIFNQQSFERNSKENVRTNAKLRMSLIPNPSKKDPYFGGNAYLSFDDVYKTLLPLLSNNFIMLDSNGSIQSPLIEMTARIEKLSKKRPEFIGLLDLLKNPNTSSDILLEMYQAFNLQKNTVIASETNMVVSMLMENPELPVFDEVTGQPIIENNTLFAVKDVSSTTSKSSNMRKEWNRNFYTKFVENGGTVAEIQSKITALANRFGEVISEISTDRTPSLSNMMESKAMSSLDYSKSVITKALDALFDYKIDSRALNDLLSDTKNNSTISKNTHSVLSRLKLDIARASSRIKFAKANSNIDTNLVEDSQILKNIGDAEALYQNANSDASVTAGGKSIYLHQNKAHINTLIETWKSNPELLEQLYESSPYTKGSEIMHYLLAREVPEDYRIEVRTKRLSELNVAIFANYYENSYNDVEAGASRDMSKDQYVSDHLNKILAGNKGVPTFSRTTTPSDKGTDLQIGYNHFLPSFKGYNPRNTTEAVKLNDTTVDVFLKYFESETMRMAQARDTVNAANKVEDYSNLKVHYHFKKDSLTSTGIGTLGNAFKSQYFPALSFGSKIKESSDLRELSASIRERLYDSKGMIKEELSNGEIYTSPLSTREDGTSDNSLKSDIETYIRMSMSERILNTHKSLRSNGHLEYNKDGSLSKSTLDSNIIKEHYNSATHPSFVGMAIATDFYVNSVIRNIEFSKMFTGDIAYYKDSIDYKKRVPATYTDGITPMLKPGQEFFKIAVIDAVEIASPYHDRMVSTYGEAVANQYKKINSSDAQAWITPQRWRSLMEGMRWTPTHLSLYNKMISGKAEQYTNDELKLAMQPLKGVYFYRNTDGSPLYLKYSQAVLTPQLVKGTELQKVYDAMTSKNGFDELITLDGVKVGSPATTRIHDSTGAMVENPTFNIFHADSRGWKLQQDLPTKGYKDTEVGSQIQKNIYAGLKNNPNMEFTHDGVVKTGREIMDEITNTVASMSDRGLKSLFREFGIGEDGKISNVDKYYESLIEELKSRDGSRNIIDALEKRMTLYGVPQVKNKIDNMFASIVTKRIVKIKTNGGSFIQMSNFGMNYKEATNNGVILSPAMKTFTEGYKRMTAFEPYKYTDPSTGRDRIQAGGIFISGSFIAKYIPNYKEYTAEQLFGYTNEEGVFVRGMIDERIYKGLVGYRIPNQGLASNDALEIVGILPEENGDTIVAYTGITTKTGSDFDIDKMYLMMPSFDVKTIRVDTLNKILKSRYKGANIKQTIANLRNTFLDLEGGDSEFDFESFAKIVMDKNTKDTILEETVNELSEYLLSSANADSPSVQNLISEAGIITDKLVYTTKEGSKGADQNKLISLYQSVLTNPEVIQDIMKPIDYAFLKDNIIYLTASQAEDTNVSLYHFEPIADIDLRYDFQGGKAGVGQEANWMVDINRDGELKLSRVNNIKWGHVDSNRSVILDKQQSVNLSELDLKEYIEDLGLKDSKDIQALKDEVVDVDIMSSMVAILNAFVDIAKDPYITRGNWVLSTTNIGNALLRMGAHPLYVNAFMAQPIMRLIGQNIRKPRGNRLSDIDFLKSHIVAKKLDNNIIGDLTQGDIYRKYINVDRATTTIEDVVSSSLNLPKEDSTVISISNNIKSIHILTFEIPRTPNNVTSSNFSLRYWNSQAMTNDFDLYFQLDMIPMVMDLREITSQLKDNLEVSRMDTNGVSASVTNVFLLENMLEKLLKGTTPTNKLTGIETKFGNTPLGIYTSNLRQTYNVAKQNPTLFKDLNALNLDMAKNLAKDLGIDYFTDADLYSEYRNELYSVMMNDFFNLTNLQKTELLKDFPNEFQSFKNQYRDKYPILEELNVKLIESTTPGINSLIFLSNRKRTGSQEYRITKSWEQLREKFPEFADKLVEYSFVSTGFRYSSTQYYNLIPNSYFIDKDINSFVNNYETPSGFNAMFLMNNFDNPKVAKMIPNISPGQTTVTKTADGLVADYGGKFAPTRYMRHGGILHERISDTSINVTFKKISNPSYSISGVNISDYNGNFMSDINKSIITPSTIRDINYVDLQSDLISDFDLNSKIPIRNVEVFKSITHSTDLLQGVEFEDKLHFVGKIDNNDNIFIVDLEGNGQWVKYDQVSISETKGIITDTKNDGKVLIFNGRVYDLNDFSQIRELTVGSKKNKPIITNQLDLFGNSVIDKDFNVSESVTIEPKTINDLIESFRSKLMKKGFTTEAINSINQDLQTAQVNMKQAEEYLKNCIK